MAATFVTGGLGLGLGAVGAAALAGAVKLGLAAKAFLLHRGGGYGGGGYGGGGYGGGYGGYEGGGFGRRKRSAEDESEALARVLDLIRREDVAGCGLRLVCELASSEEEELTVEELSILNIVGPPARPEERISSENGVNDYRVAKSIGLERENCTRAYSFCPLDGTQLRGAIVAHLP
ncbi:keratin, type I cytoskeletal 17-like [Macrobrachium nipponense]|uniref:keratin, type I cytoskeletal 17-like n=1 Tax=Macrobrachium nipponense TaxID=159736 RepID=UPI0030C8226C